MAALDPGDHWLIQSPGEREPQEARPRQVLSGLLEHCPERTILSSLERALTLEMSVAHFGLTPCAQGGIHHRIQVSLVDHIFRSGRGGVHVDGES